MGQTGERGRQVSYLRSYAYLSITMSILEISFSADHNPATIAILSLLNWHIVLFAADSPLVISQHAAHYAQYTEQTT